MTITWTNEDGHGLVRKSLQQFDKTLHIKMDAVANIIGFVNVRLYFSFIISVKDIYIVLRTTALIIVFSYFIGMCVGFLYVRIISFF